MAFETAKERAAFRLTPVWQIFRRYITSNKNYTCEFCGKQYKDIKNLNVHHRFESQYDNLSVDRFMVLCKTCHEFIHSKYNSPAFRDRKLYGLRD